MTGILWEFLFCLPLLRSPSKINPQNWKRKTQNKQLPPHPPPTNSTCRKFARQSVSGLAGCCRKCCLSPLRHRLDRLTLPGVVPIVPGKGAGIAQLSCQGLVWRQTPSGALATAGGSNLLLSLSSKVPSRIC